MVSKVIDEVNEVSEIVVAEAEVDVVKESIVDDKKASNDRSLYNMNIHLKSAYIPILNTTLWS